MSDNIKKFSTHFREDILQHVKTNLNSEDQYFTNTKDHDNSLELDHQIYNNIDLDKE